MSRSSNTKTLLFAHYPDAEQLNPLEVFTLDHDVITGSPLTSDAMIRSLRAVSYQGGYTFFTGPAGWVSVKKTLCLPRSYSRTTLSYADDETGAKTDATVVTFDLDRFDCLAVATSRGNMTEEVLAEWFLGAMPPALYSHKPDEEVVAFNGPGVRVKQMLSEPDALPFVVEFALKLKPIQK